MGEQQITPAQTLDTSDLDQVSGGIIVHEVTSSDARQQEQNDKLRNQEQNDKRSESRTK